MVDTTAPTVPGTPVASSPTATSVVLTWTPSTDDTAVTAYDVYDGASLLGSTISSISAWTARTLSNSATWSSIAYGNGIFVAVSAGNNSVQTSPDGITWTSRSLPVVTNWQAITYGNGIFVALSQGNTIAATSSDGITWTQRTLPSSSNWYSVTYGNGVFVTVSYGSNAAATSSDGITWTARFLSSSANWSSVTYGNGTFVAVAAGAGSTKASTSPDGVTWTARTLPSASWNSVAYGNSTFTAVSSSAVAATSPDGVTWTSRTLPSSATWVYIVYGAGIFTTIAQDSNKSATSPDGVTWTARTLPSSPTWNSIAYGNNTFTAVATGTSAATLQAVSPNTYTAAITQGSSYNFNVKARDAAGNTSAASPSLVYSTIPTTPGAPVVGTRVGTSLPLTWAASTDDVLVASYDIYNGATLLGSVSGVNGTWTQRALPSSAGWRSVAYGNGIFVAISSGGSGTTAATSADGSTWAASTLPAAATWFSIAFGNGIFVAIATGSAITAVSANGTTWSSGTLPGAASAWNSITFGNGKFVAVSSTSGTTAAYSTDGINWTSSTLPSTASWASVTYGSNTFVAIASGTSAATSTDGITWTSQTILAASWASITYGNSVFVAVASGSAIAATSTNGVSWTQRTLPVSSNWQAITFGNGVFVAISSTTGTISAASTDGITWTSPVLPTSSLWFSVAYGNNTFVAIAFNTSIAATLPAVAPTSYTATVARDNNYSFKVQAKDPSGTLSAFSPTTAYSSFDVTPPGTPTNLAVTAVTTTSVALSWTASTDDWGVNHYEVLRDGTTLAGSPAGTTFTDSGRSAGTQYSYQVRAVDNDNNLSGYTAALATTTPPVDLTAAPQGRPAFGGTTDNLLAVASPTATPYLLAWTRSGNALTPITLSTAMPSASNAAIAWSPDGQYLAIGLAAAPRIWMYYYNGSTLTRINTSLTSTNTFNALSWDPTSTYLATATSGTSAPIYVRTGSGASATFTTASTITFAGAQTAAAWSPDGNTLAVGSSSSPFLFLYSVSAGVYTPVYAPAPGIGVNDITWSPDSKSLAVTSTSSPYLYFYYRDNTSGIYTQYSPSVVPVAGVRSVSWSKDGQYAVTGHDTSPYVTQYLRAVTATGFTFTAQSALPIYFSGPAQNVRYGKSNLAVASSNLPYLVLTSAPTADTTAPAAPTNVAYQSIVGQTITLTWTASSSSDNVSYLIRRNGTVVANVAAYQTYFKDTPFTPATTYTYDIGAQDGAGNVTYSSTVAVPTPVKSAVPTWTYRTIAEPFSPTITVGTFQYVNDRFMALSAVSGVSTGVVTSSTDGYTWSNAYSPVIAASTWGAVAYGGGKYAAIGFSTTFCAYSTDGVSWTNGTTLTTSALFSKMVYGGGKFVAITSATDGRTAAYSTDGVTWTINTTALPSPPSGFIWRDLAYGVVGGMGTFVAISGTGTIAASSTDGITWTARGLPSSSAWLRVACANGKFIATNSTNTGAVSTDGTSWNSLSFPSWVTPGCIVADASTNTFYAKDNANNYWTLMSTDGVTWIPRPQYTAYGTVTLAAGSGVFVMAQSATNSYIFYTLGNFTGLVDAVGFLGGNRHVNWSDDNTLALAVQGPPSLAMFNRNGNVITKVADPDVLPVLAAIPIANSISQAVSPDGAYIAVGGTITPYLFLYYWNGTTLSKVSITTGTISSQVNALAWDATGTLLAVYNTNTTRIFKRSGSGTSATLTEVSTVAGLTNTSGFAWVQPPSSSVQYLIVVATSSPFFAWYSITTSTGAIASTLTNPTPVPSAQTTNAYSVAWSPDGNYLAVTTGSTPYIILYSRTGTSLTKITAAITAVATQTPVGLSWSPSGATLTLPNNASPYLAQYTLSGSGTSAVLTPVATVTDANTVGSLMEARHSPTSGVLAGVTNLAPLALLGAVPADITPPTVPTISSVTRTGSSVTVSWDTNADVALYEIFRGGISQGTLTASTFTQTVADGTYTYTVRAKDTAGNWSAQSTGVSITVDTTPPTVSTISSITNTGLSVTVSWNFNADAVLYEVFRAGVSQGTTASTSFTQTVPSDGIYAYTVRGQDAAGNWSAPSSSSGITVDTTPPTVPNTPTFTRALGSKTVVLSWNSNVDAASYIVLRGGSSIATPTTNTYSDTVSTDGTYSYTIKAVDSVGNTSAASSALSVTVDTTPPSIPVISSVTNTGLFVTVSWNSNVDVTLYEIFRDTVSQGTTTNTSFSQTVPADAVYGYTVRARDAAGNWSAQTTSSSITVDTTPPTLSGVIASRTALGTSDRTVAIFWTQGNDATQFQVRRNGITIHSDSSPATSYNDTPLTDNVYTYGIRVADVYNNFTAWSDASSILVDTTAPTTPTVSISSTPTTKNVVVSWNTNADVSVYQVYRGGTLLQDNVSGISYNDTVPTDGSYTYTVRGKDISNNWSSYGSASITIDTTPPTVPNTPTLSVAAAPSRTVTASWNTNADVALYEVMLDGTSQDTTTSTSYNINNVTDGTHTVSVRARDAASNWSAYSSTGVIVIDRTAPTVPNAPTSTRALGSRTVVLSWNSISDAVSYNILRDGTQIATSSTNTYSDTVSTDGTYSYTVESVDAAGNSSTVSSADSVVVDTSPPAVPTNMTATSGNTMVLTWTAVSGAATYNVYRGGSPVGSVSGSTFTETPADGTYTYTVTSLDVYSNESAQSSNATSTIDNTPPAVPTISVNSSTGSRIVTVFWDFLVDAATFEVKRNGTSVTTTATGTTYHDTVPTDGTFIYTVRAKDTTGNVSAFSTGQQIVIDTLPPTVPTNIHGSATRYTALVLWDNDSDVTQYEISRNGTVVGNSVFSSYSDTIPGYGTYFYKVRAKDAGGNWSAYSSEVEIDSIDTVPPATPTNLTITILGRKHVSLAWDADSDVSSWEIYRNGSLLTSRTTNSYVDDIPNFGTTTYKIRAKDLAGNTSGYTSDQSVSFSANVPTLFRSPLNNITLNERPSDDEEDQIRRMSREDGDQYGGEWPLP